MSTLIDVAEAVAASLNNAAFGLPFEAVRRYQPVFDLEQVQTLTVSVVPRSLEIATASRDGSYFDAAIDVSVQKKVNPDDHASLDALTDLVEQIADHLRMKRLDGLPDALWLRIGNEPVFAPEHLDQMRQFTSVLTVTYRVKR